MAKTHDLDVVIIGGGPAGYVGAIRAAQLGLRTACVEKDRLGGVCNNWGCIPTKALLAAAELYQSLKHDAGEWGILAPNVSHDWSKVIARSRGVADLGDKGVGALFKKNKVTHLKGAARIAGRGKVEVRSESGEHTDTLLAKHIVIATGARPRELPGAPFDGQRIISSKEAMSLGTQPRKLLIIGAGAIGAEFAYFYNAFGTQVTLIEMMPRLLPIEDDDVCKAVEKSFTRGGITCLTAHKTLRVEKTKAGVQATVAPAADEKKTQTLEADAVLVAIGVTGNTEGLFDPGLGVQVVKGHIQTDYIPGEARQAPTYQTAVPGIYAVGDVIGPPWLAHVASEEAAVCVERIAGHHPEPIDYGAIPGCTYCQPQVASLGKTERALKEQGLVKDKDYTVGQFPYLASGKARAIGGTEGFVKLIAGKKHGELLGAHLVGEAVTELLAEVGLAMRLEATVDEIISTMHAHPTLSEAMHEAALGARGRMLHF